MSSGVVRAASVLLAAAAVLLLSACAARESTSTVRHSPGSDMYGVRDDDSAMNAAIAHAQATLDDFAAVLRAPKAKQRDFSLKVKLTDGTNVEHVWLSEPVVTDTQVSGTIGNDVEQVSGYSVGQHVTFDRDQVSDWMYVDHGVLQGGFTILVLRDQMSPSEREAFDKSLPFSIE